MPDLVTSSMHSSASHSQVLPPTVGTRVPSCSDIQGKLVGYMYVYMEKSSYAY